MRNIGKWISAAAWRGIGYFGLWVLLIGLDPLDLTVGAFAAAAATWTSLRLLPPARHPVRWAGLPGLALAFLWHSVAAGVDVARRAFAPRLDLEPGFLLHPTHYRRGAARNTFAALTSLMPGTLPVNDDDEGVLYHCLDVRQPVGSQLAEQEAAIARVLPQADQG